MENLPRGFISALLSVHEVPHLFASHRVLHVQGLVRTAIHEFPSSVGLVLRLVVTNNPNQERCTWSLFIKPWPVCFWGQWYCAVFKGAGPLTFLCYCFKHLLSRLDQCAVRKMGFGFHSVCLSAADFDFQPVLINFVWAFSPPVLPTLCCILTWMLPNLVPGPPRTS